MAEPGDALIGVGGHASHRETRVVATPATVRQLLGLGYRGLVRKIRRRCPRHAAVGHAGIQNPLFRENTQMLFGDAKDRVEDIVRALDALVGVGSGPADRH